MKSLFINAFAFVSLGFLTSFAFAEQPGVSVSVAKTTLASKTIYQYTVTNNGRQRVVGFSLGSDYAHGVSELTAYPEKWSPDTGISPGTISSPAKWNASVITTEESANIEIQWRNDGTVDIMPGQSLSGFAVTVPEQSADYTGSHWTAILGNGTAESGLLTQSGAPRIVTKIGSANPQGSNMYSVELEIINTGGAATNVTISKIIFRTLLGNGSVTLASPLTPIVVGNIPSGERKIIALLVNAPQGVSKYSIAEQGTLKDAAGVSSAFSSSQVIYTKQ